MHTKVKSNLYHFLCLQVSWESLVSDPKALAKMMLAARSMLHLRPPAPGLSVHRFAAVPGKKRCPSITRGPSTSLVTCATYGPPHGMGLLFPGAAQIHVPPGLEGEEEEEGVRRRHLKVKIVHMTKEQARHCQRMAVHMTKEHVRHCQRMAVHMTKEHAKRDPRVLTTMIKACGDLTSFQDLSLSHGDFFNYINVSAMMVKVAKAYRVNNADEAQHLMLQLSAIALKRVDDMEAQQIAIILWAVGKVGGIRDASFISSWLLAAELKLLEFNAQNLANSLWAAATLGIKDERFISSLMLAAKVKLPEFTAQALANSLLAAAKLGIRDEPFICSLMLAAKPKLSQFNAQDFSNSLWAAATLGIRDGPFISLWMLAAKVKLPDFTAQGLANSLWAAATLGIRDEPFISSWLLAAKVKLPEFNAQNLANSLWAAATLGIRDEPFISSWLLAAKVKLPEFNAQELANSLWAAATIGIRDEPFISS
eukprot:gene27759-biopygen5186